MPIQSAFTSQAPAEASVVRSRAGQTEQREGGEVFALPEAEAASKAGAAGKAAASPEAAAAKDAAGPEQVVDPAKVKAQLEASKAAVSPAVSTSAPVQSGTSAPQEPKTDASGVAFLIAMAAAQMGSQAKPVGEGEATETGEAAGEAQDGSTQKESKNAGEGEIAVAIPAPVAETQIPSAPVPVAVLPALLPQGPLLAIDAAEGETVETISTEGGAKKDTARPQFAAAAAGLPVVAMPAEQAPAAGAVTGETKTAPGVHAVGPAGQGVKELADILVKADQPAAANGTSATAELKTLDSLQQPATPFDLSTLLQQAPGKSGHERLVQPFDPNAAAGAAPGAPGQGTASGQPTPIHVVPIEIGLRAMSGSRQFDIRLDPDELGRVDVSLSISDKGEVSAKLVVDRVETLHLLQRDARTLERAFEQAGLKPSDGGVDITLRDPSDQSAFRQNRQQDEAPQRARQPDGADLAEDAPLSIDPAPQRRLIRLGGVDLSI